MRLILIGCEYAGKRTLGHEIWKWWSELTGSPYYPPPHTGFHDHFVVPYVVHPVGHPEKEEMEDEMLTLSPALLEHFQRYQIEYHFSPGFLSEPDHWLIDWYYGDAVYAPLYYGYGGPGEYAERAVAVRSWDHHVMECMPDTVLVLLKASSEVIKQRRRDNQRPKSLLQEKDVDFVLQRFQEEFDKSLIRQRFALDTTSATVEENLQEFVAQIQRFLTPEDRLRILSHQALKK